MSETSNPASFDGRENFRQSGDVAAGKMYFGDPWIGDTGSLRAADGVQHHDAVLCQEFSASLEVGVVMVDADMFEHADGDDAVEWTGDVAIVLEQEFRAVFEVFLAGPGIGDLQLFGGQRNAGDIGTGHLLPDRAQARPSRSRCRVRVGLFDEHLGREVALLGELGVVQGRVRSFEIGAAILLVGIQKQ